MYTVANFVAFKPVYSVHLKELKGGLFEQLVLIYRLKLQRIMKIHWPL